MTSAARDADREAARAPGVPPRVLADIAARRWDLHADIAANPSAYPELVAWMRAVNPASPVPQQHWSALEMPPSGDPNPGAAAAPEVTSSLMGPAPHPSPQHGPHPPAPARRSSIGWWIAGCGCLAVAVLAVIVLVAFLGLGAALAPSDTSGEVDVAPMEPSAPTIPDGSATATDPLVAEQIALFHADQTKINELARQLDGSPVAPLVADLRTFRLDEQRASDPTIGIAEAQPIADRAADLRASLEESIDTAEARRANASGSLTEGIVDAAGNGFIDIQWDAATACSTEAAPGKENIGCVRAADPLTVHVLPENEVGSTWMNQMLVVHELAHVYQRADDLGAADYSGSYNDLLAQGLFQGSKEAMADCFALTYYDQWSLTNGAESQGTGYVCDESERQAIREWAVGLNAPMG